MTSPTQPNIDELIAGLWIDAGDLKLSRNVRKRAYEAAQALQSLRGLLQRARHHVVFTIDVDPNAGDLANEISAILTPHQDSSKEVG